MKAAFEHLLIIEPDESQRKGLAFGLCELFTHVLSTASPVEAYQILEKQAFDVILSEYRFPMFDGDQVLKRLMKLAPRSRLIILTVPDQKKEMDPKLSDFVDAILGKPVQMDVLKNNLKHK